MIKTLLLLILLLSAPFALRAQDKVTFSGTVIDTNGEAVSGVHISVSDTRVATVTNLAGEFSFSLDDPTAKSALFSHVGMKELSLLLSTVTEQKDWRVVMEPKILELGSITVTALGISRVERALGYSATTVKGKELDQNTINPISTLQGKVAGLNISGTDGGLFGRTKISLRGASTLNSNNQPLIIVDGMAINTSVWTTAPDWLGQSDDWGDELKNLNVSDIESISVLKGAASTALYGSRGMNGALVITTKRGVAVGGKRTTAVRFSQSIGVDMVIKTPSLQTAYGPGTIAGDVDYGNRADNGEFQRWDTDQFYLNSEGNPTLIGANNFMWGPRFDGRDIVGYDGLTTRYAPQENGYRDFYRPAVQSNTNISVSGGNEKTTFYLSGGYQYTQGTLPSMSFSRGSTTLKADHRITERVTVQAQVSLSQSKPDNISPSVGDFYINRAVNTLYDPSYYRHKYMGEHGGMASAAHGDAYANVPLKDYGWEIDQNNRQQRETSVRPKVNIGVVITDWLSFQSEASADYYNTTKETKLKGRGYRNQGNDDNSGGRYEMFKTSSREETLSGMLTAERALGDFRLGGFLRSEYRNAFADYTLNATNSGLITPGLYSISNSRGTPTSDYTITSRKRVASAVFAVNTAWRDQLYLEATGRNDWSSSLVYSDGSGDYSYFYPSVSASWVASSTFALPDWVTFGKLRLSWAQVGNDAAPFAINPGYEQKKYLQPDGSYVYTETVPAMLYDGTLKPELKTAWEAGTNWSFLKGRVGFDVAIYKENTRNQILSIPTPKEGGTVLRMINAGNIENKGIEIAVNTTPIKTKDWQWTIDLTYAKNRNKIISLHPEVQNYINLAGVVGDGNYRIASVAQQGGPYGLLVSDIMPERDASGNTILAWDDEMRTAYPKQSNTVGSIGSMMPDFTGSIATALRYKNLTFRAQLDVRWGGYIASYSNRYGLAYGVTEASMKYRDPANGGLTWTSSYTDTNGQSFGDGVIPDGVFAGGTIVTTPSGDRVDVSGLTFRQAYEQGYVEPVHASSHHYFRNGWSTGTVNDDWVHQVKYIALREISLGYKLPEKIAKKMGAQGVNLLLSARNLGYIYNSLPNNLHPESVRGTATAEFRERGFIPYTATFMATVSIDF